MAKRERVEKQKVTRKQEDEIVPAEETKKQDTEALKAEIDDILEEIDSVLETNAEEFVKAYVQKGGE